MLRALILALRQIGDPAFRRVWLLGAAGALLVLAGCWALAWWLAVAIPWTALPGLETLAGWLGGAGGWLGGAALFLALLAASFLLFPAVMTAVMGLFQEEIAEAVEARHYPDLPAAQPPALARQAAAGARLIALVVAVNAVALPLYLLGLFVPPVGLGVYYAVNGWLLGREFFEIVALRRMDPAAVARLRRAVRGRLWLAGAMLAAGLSLPLLNLAVPVLGVAMMTHYLHRRLIPAARPLPAGPGDPHLKGRDPAGPGPAASDPGSPS